LIESGTQNITFDTGEVVAQASGSRAMGGAEAELTAQTRPTAVADANNRRLEPIACWYAERANPAAAVVEASPIAQCENGVW